MTDTERLLLEVLGQQLEIQRDILAELQAQREQMWQCGCGRANSPHASVCAQCGRRQGADR